MLTFLQLAVGLIASCNLIVPMWESRSNNTVMCLEHRTYLLHGVYYNSAIWDELGEDREVRILVLPGTSPFQHSSSRPKYIYIMAARSPRLRRSPCLVSFPAATILKFLVILNKRPHFHFAEDSANSVTSPIYNVRHAWSPPSCCHPNRPYHS